MNPVLVVRIRVLGDGPTKEDREGIVRKFNEATNPDVCVVLSAHWEGETPQTDMTYEQLLGRTSHAIGRTIDAFRDLQPVEIEALLRQLFCR